MTIKPITREDMYYNYLINGGSLNNLPKPITRREHYLYYLCEMGFSSGGSVTPEEIRKAVEKYMEDNPIPSGTLPDIYATEDIPEVESDSITLEDKMLLGTAYGNKKIDQNALIEFLKGQDLIDLDGKGRPLLPGYGIVTADNVVINYTNGTGISDRTIEELFGITDNSTILYIFGFSSENGGSQSPSCAIDANNKIRASYGATNFKGAVYTFACIQKLPVPYEPGLRAVSLTKTLTMSSGGTAEFAKLDEFCPGLKPSDVVSLDATAGTAGNMFAILRPDLNTGDGIYIASTSSGNKSLTTTVSLIVKDYSSIGPAIVTDGIRMITKTVAYTNLNNSNPKYIELSEFGDGIQVESIIGVMSNSITGNVLIISGYGHGKIQIGTNQSTMASGEANISLFVRVPVVEQLPRFTKDVESSNIASNGSISTGIILDGSEEAGGYTLDNFHNINVTSLTFNLPVDGWYFTDGNVLNAITRNPNISSFPNVKLRVTIE